MREHHWVRAERLEARAAAWTALDVAPVLAVVDAHRRSRGPYSAAGALFRLIADDLLDRCPDVAAAHNIELLTAVPEMAGRVPSAWHTLEWSVTESERTRYYSRLHTRNVANGLAEVLRDYLAALGEPRTLVVDNVHLADPTDQEFVAVLMRRGDLPLLTVIAASATAAVPDPLGEIDVSLAAVLVEHATALDAPATVAPVAPADPAQAYVDGDGTSDDPVLLAAYQALPPAERARLHDARADALAALPDFSPHLGAIPYHREHGSDPAGAGAQALRAALDHCRAVGLYHAAADLAVRGQALVDSAADHDTWWHFTHSAGIVMATAGRADEAEALYVQGRAATIDASKHMELSYATAMLHARHYPEDRRDYAQARAWMNTARAMASLIPDPKTRAFQSVFAGNGLALVEVRERNTDEALRLLETGMARLDDELDEGEHALHRLVLRYNRAQVYGGMGKLEEALVDYAAVLEKDAMFPEHHFNIGTILRRLGRHEEALAAFRRSLELSPPFPEGYYNIADALSALGDDEGALAAFTYVTELDPDHTDARLNRAALLLDAGDTAAAAEQVALGLARDPGNPHLLCLKAQVHAERDEYAEAAAAVTAALAVDAKLAPAWAVHGVIAVETGASEAALAHFDRALALADDPAVRYNRAIAQRELGRFAEAVADLDAVLAVVDDADAARVRDECARALAAAR
jgi:tetratricopeptide (TPR) repeat protein